MPFRQSGNVRYYTFDSLDEAGVVHAVFTRQGGVSPTPWEGLNLGGAVGDDPLRVAENRRRALLAAGRPPDSVYDAWQVHSADVVFAEGPRPPQTPQRKADIILSDCPGVTLLMRFADCTPILLYDPVRRVVGLVHAGWQGTVKRAAEAALEAMQARYASKPADVVAAIGPSIGVHHYPVGPEVVRQVNDSFGQEAHSLLPSHNGAVQFDLWAANRLVLQTAGVRQVETAGLCTACSLKDWYSHRAERGRTGRFGVLIGL